MFRIILLMNHSLQTKVDYSIDLIRRAESTALRYRPEGFFVAFSGGKDSQVLLDLVKRAEVRYTAQYNLTTLDPPENVHFIKEHYPTVEIVRPEKSFIQICRHHQMLPTQWTRFCCKELKESTNEHAVTLTGIRRSESARRSTRQEVFLQTRRRHPEFTEGTFDQFSRHQETTVECLRGKDKLTVNPLLEWNERDIWDYIHEFALPINPLYNKGYSRVGCLFCPMANIKNIRREAHDYPKYYKAMLRLIHRIRAEKFSESNPDVWGDCTDEEVFWYWANKTGPLKAQAERLQTKLEFAQ